MMTVRLIAHTPEPEKVVAAAAKLCYSDAHITDLLDGLDEEKTARFLTMLSDLGHASPIEHASFTFGNHLNRMVDNFERAVMNYRPMLDGERFMTDTAAHAKLKPIHDTFIKKNLTFLPMQNLSQVLAAALLKPKAASINAAFASGMASISGGMT